MKKNLVRRALLGGLIGLNISYLISIVISVILNRGEFYPVAPNLIESCGGEMNAVMIQAAVSLLYGAVMAGASVIWEKDDWSILKQTVLHCIIVSVVSLPIAYFMHWMPHNVWGVLIYFSTFFLIYFIIWLSQYLVMKKKIQSLNSRMKESFQKKSEQ